ncbi:MAG: hypothetical protein U0103_11660 [Candidatus Obscuribacterales bacterium]
MVKSDRFKALEGSWVLNPGPNKNLPIWSSLSYSRYRYSVAATDSRWYHSQETGKRSPTSRKTRIRPAMIAEDKARAERVD